MRRRSSSKRKTPMINHEQDLVSLDELRSTLNTYAGPDDPRERPTRDGFRAYRYVLLVAAAVVALIGTGVGIADGFGAFDGIGSAQHPQTGADVLDAQTLAGLQKACPSQTVQAFYMPFCHLVLDSARFVSHVPSYGNVYVVTDTRGDLCTLFEGGRRELWASAQQGATDHLRHLQSLPHDGWHLHRQWPRGRRRHSRLFHCERKSGRGAGREQRLGVLGAKLARTNR